MIWVQVLRDTLNCTLPIEIIYNGPREMDEWAVNKFQVSPMLRAQSNFLVGCLCSCPRSSSCPGTMVTGLRCCVLMALLRSPHRMQYCLECIHCKEHLVSHSSCAGLSQAAIFLQSRIGHHGMSFARAEVVQGCEVRQRRDDSSSKAWAAD